MRVLIILVAAAALAGCGVESVGTAATAAAIKKQEIEQGKKTMEQTQEKLNQVMQATQQRADQAAEEK